MTNIITKIILTGATLGVSACGYGGGDSGNAANPSALYFGSNTAAASANGLAFASTETQFANLEGQTAKVRMVRFVSDAETGQTEVLISDETFAIDNIDDSDFTATFGGETISFDSGSALRESGIDINIDEQFDGNFSKVVSIFSYVDGSDDFDTGENTEGFLVTGFETSPDAVAGLGGTVNYTGTFDTYGTLLDQTGVVLENEVLNTGSVMISADFGSNMVAGSIQVGLEDFDNGATLDLVPTAIDGNGFGTDLVLASCTDGFTCTADAQVGGVFYGPNGEELSGIAGLDLSQTDADGNGIQYVGAGGFISTPD